MTRRQMIKATLAAIAGAALPMPTAGQVGEAIVFRRLRCFMMASRHGKTFMTQHAMARHEMLAYGHSHFQMPERRQ